MVKKTRSFHDDVGIAASVEIVAERNNEDQNHAIRIRSGTDPSRAAQSVRPQQREQGTPSSAPADEQPKALPELERTQLLVLRETGEEPQPSGAPASADKWA